MNTDIILYKIRKLKKSLNKKGFTLFTALVSLLLISITLILIFNMVRTEETYLSLITDQASLSDLITIADLARADAFNSFVVNLRSKWEDHYDEQENTLYLSREDVEKDWNSFSKDFVREKFFDKDFSRVFAQSLINELDYSLEPTGYKLDINILFEDVNTLGEIVQEMFDASEHKIDIVDCNQQGDECLGSFYLNLDTRTLNDINYEKLPRITVLKYKSNDVIQRPVLARQVYKIYMPWRGFQALRVARRLAYSKDVETNDDPFSENLANDPGLFNPEIHNILEQARLGVCDPDTCRYRENLFKTPEKTGFSDLCLNYNDPISVTNQPYNVGATSIEIDNGQSYKLYDLDSGASAIFSNLLEKTISSNVTLRLEDKILFEDDFKMEGSNHPGTDINFDVAFSLGSKRSKQIIHKGDEGDPNESIAQHIFAANHIFSNSSGGFGLFEKTDMNHGILLHDFDYGYFTNNENKLEGDFLAGNGPNIPSGDLRCFELDTIKYKLNFKETNPKYMVNDNNAPHIYVDLVDNYYGFKFPNDNFQTNLSLNNNKGLITGSLDNYNVSPNKWVCYSCQAVPNNSCTSVEPS